ncbi:MAG TPA: gamma-glutamyl-gamma-aminobutyrate hydrolase family protein [Lacipirellulaceae bacterium]|nr:gamma-glutamyl-gamma-aminobutyrate hydrolase family protein [Lacipirellulaceae bacterium]
MRVHFLQHVPFEGLASIESWLRGRGYGIRCTRMFAGDDLPAEADFDWLIVMGGPMGANDDAIHPWLRSEKLLIERAIGSGKAVLGICLGAQLIAHALGAKVYKNEHREIGWFNIERSQEALTNPFGELLPPKLEVFHWHGDTFELPAGATRLASSAACINQAFAVGTQVAALQFHLEVTRDSAAMLIDHCADELASGPYVQDAAEMLASSQRFATANQIMGAVLARMASRP